MTRDIAVDKAVGRDPDYGGYRKVLEAVEDKI